MQKMFPFHYIFLLYLNIHHCKTSQFPKLQKFYLFTSHHIKQYIIKAVINGNSLQIWFKFRPARLSPKPIQLMQWGMMDGGGLWRVHTKHRNTKDKSEWLIPGMAYCGTFTCYQVCQLLLKINSLRQNDPYIHQYTMPSYTQVMVCRLFCTRPLCEPMPVNCQIDPREHISIRFYLKITGFHWRKCLWKCWPFCLRLNVWNMKAWTNSTHFADNNLKFH